MDYRVVMNADEQYSVWAVDDDLPPGWVAEGHRGSRDECLDHVERVWTDQTPARTRIRAWLADIGCTELSFAAPSDATFRVGMNRLDAPAAEPLAPGTRMFAFT